jgi:peptide/nickel transport system permease protein
MERTIRRGRAVRSLRVGGNLRDVSIAVARRLALGLLTVWLIASVTFCLVITAPGDPVVALLGDDPDEDVRQRAALSFGTDQSAATQYALWIRRLARLDLGVSTSFRAPVDLVILDRLPTTLALVLPSVLLSSLLAVVVGMATAAQRRAWRTAGTIVLSTLFAAIPIYVLAHALIAIFAVKLSWLPMQGLRDAHSMASGIADILERIRHFILPILTLMLHQLVFAWLYLRGRIRQESRSVYLRTARAKGLTSWQVYYRHLWPNIRLGFAHFVAARLGQLLAGAALVETVFGLAGMGRLVVTASLARDVPLVTGIFLFMAALVVLANMTADALTYLLDPRVADEERHA